MTLATTPRTQAIYITYIFMVTAIQLVTFDAIYLVTLLASQLNLYHRHIGGVLEGISRHLC